MRVYLFSNCIKYCTLCVQTSEVLAPIVWTLQFATSNRYNKCLCVTLNASIYKDAKDVQVHQWLAGHGHVLRGIQHGLDRLFLRLVVTVDFDANAETTFICDWSAGTKNIPHWVDRLLPPPCAHSGGDATTPTTWIMSLTAREWKRYSRTYNATELRVRDASQINMNRGTSSPTINCDHHLMIIHHDGSPSRVLHEAPKLLCQYQVHHIKNVG